MFDKWIAILGIVGTTSIAFVIALILSSVSNQATTQIEESLQPIIKDNPQAGVILKTGKTLDDADGLANDMKTVQNTPAKGLKNASFVYPIMVLVAGGLLIWKKLQ